MVRFGICDDDRKFALGFCAVLLEYLKKLYGTGIECECKTYSSGEELLENYKADQIDIVFMDIEVGDESGFAIAKKLISIEEDMGIVYVTNYECYISDAFVCRPLGFVRKAKVEKDIERTLVSVIEYAEKKKRTFRFHNGEKVYDILAGNIRVIEVYNHKIVIRFKDKDIVLNDKLSRIEKEVLPFSFVKISRSCLINLKYVEKMDKNHCIMSNGDSLHIAEDRIKTVNERWLQYAMRH